MNAILLDTHVLVWLLNGSEQLSPTVRAAIEIAARQDGLYISAITPWEIGMLVAKERLRLAQDVQDWIDEALTRPELKLAPLDPSIAIASTRLPGNLHGDPAERILAATARKLEIPLLTADEKLIAYGKAGHMRFIEAAKS